jgi:hypothetical protein
MQLAIHRTDQSKLLPVFVLLHYARLSDASHCAILGCVAQIRTSSVVCKQPGMCFEKNLGLRQAFGEVVQRCGEGLRHGFEPRLESLALRFGLGGCPAQCERRAALVLGKSRYWMDERNSEVSQSGALGRYPIALNRRPD